MSKSSGLDRIVGAVRILNLGALEPATGESVVCYWTDWKDGNLPDEAYVLPLSQTDSLSAVLRSFNNDAAGHTKMPDGRIIVHPARPGYPNSRVEIRGAVAPVGEPYFVLFYEDGVGLPPEAKVIVPPAFINPGENGVAIIRAASRVAAGAKCSVPTELLMSVSQPFSSEEAALLYLERGDP